MRRLQISVVLFVLICVSMAKAAGPAGYYRQPALHGETLVFVAEGDLWKVKVTGGIATRITSHPAEELYPAISPDGSTLAFTASYEGPAEVYTMPLTGGLPTRRTYDGTSATVRGWTPDGKIIVATKEHSTYPATQLVLLDITRPGADAARSIVPLAQAAEGCYDEAGQALYFTRLPFQGSHTKRYKGGTAQNIWRYSEGDAEARPLTASYAGTSKGPMWWSGRVYFLSDRDGTMNIWSMKGDGTDLVQHTKHTGWDVMSASMWNGKIVYQLGADIHLYEITSDTDKTIPITLDSDLDQMREKWVKKPMDYLTAAHISPDGDRVVLTARGRVFVAPAKNGRFVEATRKEGVRYRDGRFLPDGKSLVALSDQSGEIELWKLPANGVGEASQLTNDGNVLRWMTLPSPDGKFIAHTDKNNRLFVYDAQKRTGRKVEQSPVDTIEDLVWSANSKWLAYVAYAENDFKQIRLYSVDANATITVTTDRFDSYSPAFSHDGKWLFFLTDRNLRSTVASPWGSYQPEPYLDRKTQIFALALKKALTRSPWTPKDELDAEKPAAATQPTTKATTQPGTAPHPALSPEYRGEGATRPALWPEYRGEGTTRPTTLPTTHPTTQPTLATQTEIDIDGIQERLFEVPVPAGNYRELTANEKALFWLSRSGAGEARGSNLMGLNISSDAVEVKTVAADVRGYELSQDGKKLLLRRGDSFLIGNAATAGADPKDVDLSRWSLSVIPHDEWRDMFVDAWRLERDYFYDRGMHGTDWKALLEKYRPLVERVTTRAELSDLISQMVAELSALHIFVRGGDQRGGDDNVQPASLGAALVRDTDKGGYRIEHIHKSDPDEPARRSPLARPEVGAHEGDVIETVNGTSTILVPDINVLLRQKAGQEVLLRIMPVSGGASRDVIVTPMSLSAASDLRYHEWEYTRRQAVEKLGGGKIGYIHLRAMTGGDYTEFAKGFYPIVRREGLIIDVRHNLGGNIDAWLLSRLMRKAWFFWSNRVSKHSIWNMHYAFRGHIVVLCDEFTCSDGEAFTEGIKRLKLGTVIGTRTWGGEIWLSSSNTLVDRGIATAAETGVFGPEGNWLIEGHGVEPDIFVDNLPRATFMGQDAQLQAAMAQLQKMIKEKPIEEPTPPKYPDKSFKPETRP